ncbi:MAG: CcdB family protein [Burkholderiaceae bacterium]
MAQYDLYANPNAAQRPAYPYVVVLQTDQLDHYTTRMVMPLARLTLPPIRLPRNLTQTVSVNGEALYLAAHLCAALPAKQLKAPLDSLRSQSGVLLSTLDAVISGV